MNHVILGASAAGIHCAKTLRELDADAKITLVSKDAHVYSRCMLHHLLSNHRDLEGLDFTEKDFFKAYNIGWVKGVEVSSISTEQKTISTSDGSTMEYDKLLIATGASSFLPPIKNLREAKGVYGFRNVEDVFAIEEKAKTVKSAAVLGAGLVGIDAIMGLIDKGIKLSLVEMADRILPLQLDGLAAYGYEKKMKDKGVQIFTSVKAQEILVDASQNVTGILLNTGQKIDCEMIVAATGVIPNTSFLSENTVLVDRGIQINEKCETNVKDIYAAGDVVGKSPIWPLAVKQGIVAAYNMAGKEKSLEDSFGLKNSMNFFDLATVSIGMILPEDDTYQVDILRDEKGYKKIIHKDSIIYGAIFQGDISYSGVFTYLIKNKVNVRNINKPLWDIDYADFFTMKEDGQFAYVV